MPDDANTDNQTDHLLIDRDDWQLAFGPYQGNQYATLRLGFNLAMLRTHLDSQTIKSRPVIAALDLAMETLFPFTSFHEVSFDLFIRLTQGKLTFEEEQMLNGIGIKF